MKLYTRTGDDGTTGLLGPGRVPKSAPRVEAYGAVDELNAVLGVARILDAERILAAEFEAIQSDLFTVGAELATVGGSAAPSVPRISDREITTLESWIDRCTGELPELTQFILPGGTPLGAQLHFARTVCRRAERRVVALSASEPAGTNVVRYLNRLADLLFAMARLANHRAGVSDAVWRPGDRS